MGQDRKFHARISIDLINLSSDASSFHYDMGILWEKDGLSLIAMPKQIK